MVQVFDLPRNLALFKRLGDQTEEGTPVKIGDGPAAVIGDESCRMSLAERLGRRSR